MNRRWTARFFGVVTVGLAFGACSRGGLSDAHDRYMNVFGIPYPTLPPEKGGYIGRALLADGTPAAWVKVYSRPSGDEQSTPVLTTTNDKGGFFLSNLEPGAYDYFVVSAAGQAVSEHVAVAKAEVAENAQVQLMPTVRVAGKVTLEAQPVPTGTMVYVRGAPFLFALSDQNGSYYLDVPHGAYHIRAEKDGFTPFESDALAFDEDQTLAIHLAANPWPNGKVTVVGGDGYLVRGLSTTLKIVPVYGVRYIRIQQQYGSVQASPDFGTWVPVKDEVTLLHGQDGGTLLQIEFEDEYGKASEPVQVGYYNTSLDESWRIFYGSVNAPVAIAPGQKAAFLGGLYASDQAAAGGLKLVGSLRAGGVSPAAPPAAAAASTGATGGSSVGMGDTVFNQAVTVGAGATIRGSARFTAALTINGSKDQPVIWGEDQTQDTMTVQGPTVLHYASLRNMNVLAGGTPQSVAIDHAVLDTVALFQSQFFYEPSQAVASSLQVTQSQLRSVAIGQGCDEVGKSAGNAPPSPVGSVSLDLERNLLTQVSIHLGCLNQAPGFQVQIQMVHNNAMSLADGLDYFEADSPTGLPDQTAINYVVKDNYFQIPSRLYLTVDTGGWPKYFAANLAAPWPDVGAP